MNSNDRKNRLRAFLLAAVMVATTVCGCAGTEKKQGEMTDTEKEVQQKEQNTNEINDGKGYAYEDMFTQRDIDTEYEESEAVKVTLSQDASVVEPAGQSKVVMEDNVITITDEGTYLLTGTLTEGKIVVDAEDDKVQLVLDGVNITNENSAAIYVKSADKVFITLAEESDNYLSHTKEYEADDENNIDSVIFSKSDLTLNGNGSLSVRADYGHGIVSKDDLKITGGSYEITSAGHALSGKDSVRIAGGDLVLTAGKDGIHAENSEDEKKGYIYLSGGTLTIESDGDGIDASNIVQVEEGDIRITAGGGAVNGISNHKTEMPGRFENGAPSEKAKGGQFDKAAPPQMRGENRNENFIDTEAEDTVSTKGIKAGSSILLNGGSYEIDAADDGIHSNADILIQDGTYAVSAGDDGVHADGALVIKDGTVTVVESYEGLEGLTLTVNGGKIDITSEDDGMNAAGTGDEIWMEMNGGSVHILAGGDGIDSNGNLTINDGEVYVDGPSDNGNSAIDFGERSAAYINGGTVIAVGSSGMAEEMSDASMQEVLLVKLPSQVEAGDVVLTDDGGNELIHYIAQKRYDCVMISTPELESGQTYTLTTSGTSMSVTVDGQ